MADPSSLVPPPLLRHIHLIANHAFPKLPHFNLDILVEYLIQAPRIVKEQASMNWMFLQGPQDGDVLLVWQPPQMGVREASDGYVWADPESAFSSEMRGYKVEMYVHKTGFRLPNEPIATHARRRLRLTPSQNPDPNLPQSDPSLWILYYCQTEQQHHYPSRGIRISDQVRHTMNERVQLQRHGQLVRKEFMLRDSASWPTINLPGNSGSAYPQQPMGYPNDVMAHMNRSQQQAYMQQQQQQVSASQRGVGPSPAKRQRHSGTGHAHGSATAIPAPVKPQDVANEDEDGTVGGDYMDYLTSRDISLQRYIQHHEWLEQILESPYDTNKIIPGELGLGRKGELESLTRDFFTAPTNGTPKEKFPVADPPPEENYVPPVPPRVGRLEAGQADHFTKRAEEKIAQIKFEMEKIKKQHEKRMAKLLKTCATREAGEDVRIETMENMNGDTSKFGCEQDSKIDDIALRILGKSVHRIEDVECVQKGGLEEKSESKEHHDQDYDMVDSFNLDGVLNDAPFQAPAMPAPQKSSMNSANSVSHASHTQAAEVETLHSGTTQPKEDRGLSESSKDPAAEDWIMVNKDSKSATEDQDLGDLNSFVNDTAIQPDEDVPNPMDDTVEQQPQRFEPEAANTGGEAFEHDAGGDANAGQFEPNDFGEGIDFGDLDTAGDELSGYAQAIEDPAMNEQDVIGADNGTFGDAFPIPEPDAENVDQAI